MANNVPYKVVGGLKFYDRKEIKDIVAYLKLIYNNDDDQSFRRIVNVPKRAIGETTIKNLSDFASKNDISLFESFFTPIYSITFLLPNTEGFLMIQPHYRKNGLFGRIANPKYSRKRSGY